MMGKRNFEEGFGELRGGIGIASMVNITTGEFCGKYGVGTQMVQIGGYNSDVYEGSREKMLNFLSSEVKHAKKSGAKVALNALGTDFDNLLTFAKAFEEAGGDFLEYNAHTNSQKWVQMGLGYMQFKDENRKALYDLTGRFVKVLSIPLIVKGRVWRPKSRDEASRVAEDYGQIAEDLKAIGASGLHLNIRNESKGEADLDVLEDIRRRSKIFTLASGYVGLTADGGVDIGKAVSDTKAILEAGADMVLIGKAVMDKPEMISELAKRIG